MTFQEDLYNSKKNLNEGTITQKVKIWKLKHFIFDFGGVMLIEKTFALGNLLEIVKSDLKIDVDIRHQPYFKKNRRRLSSGRINAREFLKGVIENCCYPYMNKDERALPLKKPNVEYYLELWFNLYSQFANLSAEMEEIVHRLHDAGYKVSLMSNTYDIHARSNQLKGFYDIFDNIFLSNEIGFRKPEMEKYKHILKKLDTKPKQCVFIDDKLKNLVPARELGFIIIQFKSIDKLKQKLSEMGIGEISKNVRQEIKNKYKQYEMSKKQYKKAKKLYKKAKKEYLVKNKKSKQRRIEFQKRHAEYKSKKQEYKKKKEMKKHELTSKFEVS